MEAEPRDVSERPDCFAPDGAPTRRTTPLDYWKPTDWAAQLSSGAITPEKLRAYRDQIVLLHRHEDTLLNSRLQSFLVATAFLIGAFAQFRDATTVNLLLRGALAVAGGALAYVMGGVLERTAGAIRWYRDELYSLDPAIQTIQDVQPYIKRRLHREESEAKNKSTFSFGARGHVSDLLAKRTPQGVLALWIVLCVLAIGGYYFPESQNQRGKEPLPHSDGASGGISHAIPVDTRTSGQTFLSPESRRGKQ